MCSNPFVVPRKLTIKSNISRIVALVSITLVATPSIDSRHNVSPRTPPPSIRSLKDILRRYPSFVKASSRWEDTDIGAAILSIQRVVENHGKLVIDLRSRMVDVAADDNSISEFDRNIEISDDASSCLGARLGRFDA